MKGPSVFNASLDISDIFYDAAVKEILVMNMESKCHVEVNPALKSIGRNWRLPFLRSFPHDY